MNKKISDYSELTTPADGDLVEIVDVSDTSEAATGTNKKIQYSNLVPTIADASTTVKGKVELATDAETITGTDTVRAVTPSNITGKMDTDGTLAGNSDTRIPSQKSVKTYGDRALNTTLNIHPLYAPQGFLINGKIVPSVASNNLTVALKTLAGTDPSASDPVYCRIGDTVRTITAALSATFNAGTNWGNCGSAELATKEVDWFTYLIWNTNDTTAHMAISRYPGGCLVSDFVASSTSEKGLMYAAPAAAATDGVEVIGRFAATLSAGAGYTWSVPTYTAINLIQRPIYETRVLTWVPAWSCSGSMTYTSVTGTFVYKVSGGKVTVYVTSSGTTGGSAAVAIYYTHPFTATASHSSSLGHAGGIVNNSTQTIGMSRVGSGKSECYISTGGNWTLAAGTSINDTHSFEI